MNQLITGNVFDNPEILDFYSVDRSALKITPRFVALPESTADLERLMKFFDQLALRNVRVPIAVRGSGLDEMGADLSTGIVISTEKLNHLEEIDTRERLVRVQAGTTLKELNTALKVSGLTIPVKANENETIGGLISNCPTDNYAGKYGGIMNYVERAEIVLTNGDCIHPRRLASRSIEKKSAEKTLEGKIYQTILKISKEQAPLLEKIHQENVGSSGYPTISYAIKKDTIDLLPLFFSSEGSLGVISEVILRAKVIQPKPVRALITFSNLKSALSFLDFATTLKPLELNLFDIRILQETKDYGKNLTKIIKNTQSGFVVFVSFDDKILKVNKLLKKCYDFLPKTANIITESPENTRTLDEFENALVSFLNLTPNGKRYPILSNFFIPSKNFAQFHNDLGILEQKLKIPLQVFGSYSTSNYNVRPAFQVNNPDLGKQILALLKAGDYIIKRHDGSITGGYPEGRIKAMVTNSNFSPDEKKLYQEIKSAFDPNNILNPSIKLGADTKFTLSHLNASKSQGIML